MQLILRLLCLLFFVAGMALGTGGFWLFLLGGSGYYLAAGLAYCLAALLLLRGRSAGAAIALAVALLSLPFAIWEVGLEFWGLFAHLLSPAVIAAIACLVSLKLAPGSNRGWLTLGLLGSTTFAIA
ncbi:MAG: membrane-bound PQQ-dependent dehydrogenase, glucose/quinate/shikimate family, partial [Allorhizobium sp.]